MNKNLQLVDQGPSSVSNNRGKSFWHKMIETLTPILAELLSPPMIATVSSILSFLSFGFSYWFLVHSNYV